MQPTVSVTGGQRLQQRLSAMRDRLAQNPGVYVGVPAGAGSYEDGTPLAVIAAVNEFGSADGHIPERSFLRVPLRANQDLFAKILKRGLPDVLSEQTTSLQLMNQLGARAAAVSQEAISAGIEPPNAPSTEARKGDNKPLVDQGHLRASITWQVVEGNE